VNNHVRAHLEPVSDRPRQRRCSEHRDTGARGGFGKRPALLIIDVNYAFCDERPMPILESIKRWRNSCGEDAWVAMPYLKSLIDKGARQGHPGDLHHRRAARGQLGTNGSWSWKNGRSDEDLASKPATNVDGNEIVAEIAPATAGHRRVEAEARPASSVPTWRAISPCSAATA